MHMVLAVIIKRKCAVVPFYRWKMCNVDLTDTSSGTWSRSSVKCLDNTVLWDDSIFNLQDGHCVWYLWQMRTYFYITDSPLASPHTWKYLGYLHLVSLLHLQNLLADSTTLSSRSISIAVFHGLANTACKLSFLFLPQ